MRFIIASTVAALATALEGQRSATVEAEFGDDVVEGSELTLAHHGPRSANPAPCLAENFGDRLAIDVVGLSHVDLDTLGGILAITNSKPEGHDSFWALAAFSDVNGPHRLAEANPSSEDLARLYAFWAWSSQHRCFAPRDGSVADVTDFVEQAVDVIFAILDDDEELIDAGREFRAAEETLNRDSFVSTTQNVIARVGPQFCNHLYTDPDGNIRDAVVHFNTRTGGITISFANAPSGCSARGIVQGLWGPEAGGHVGIAGSPRDRRMNLHDLWDAVEQTSEALWEADANADD